MADIRYDAAVEGLAGDPSAGATVGITGLIGKGPKEGTVRVYVSPDLQTFVDVAEADITHTVPLPQSGSTVYVKHGAPLHHTTISSAQAQSGFLQGQLTNAYLGGTQGGYGGQEGGLGGVPTGTACCVSRSGLCTAGCFGAAEGATVQCCVTRSGLCTAGCFGVAEGATGTQCCVSRSGLCTPACF